MNAQNQAGNYGMGAQALAQETSRAFPNAMTELASQLGDLETALRALAGRISPLLPAGSPFERAEKLAGQNISAPAVPQPVRSQLADELYSRIHALRSLTGSVNEMVKSVEI